MLVASGISSFTQFETDCNSTTVLILDADRSVN